jgi:hypothetical protein
MRIPFFGKLAEEREEGGRVASLEALYQAADQARRQYEPEWQANARFLVGNQWEEPESVLRQWGGSRRRPTEPQDRQLRMTVNWVYSLVRQAVAGLRDNLAQQVAIPATNEPWDEAAADIATDFLASRYDEDDEREKRFQEILWAMVCGRVLRKTFWDADLEGKGEFGELPRAGDIATMTLPPLRYHVDPWSSTFSECSFVIESDVRDVEEVNDLWPGHGVAEQEFMDATHLLDSLLANAPGNAYAAPPKRKQAVILKRLYARPTKKQPKGRAFTWANGKLLDETELPDGIFPFEAIEWFPIPGRNTPLPFLTPLREPQRQYNLLVSQLLDLATRQLRGDVLIQGEDDVKQEVDPETGMKRIILGPGVMNFQLMRYDYNPTVAEMRLAQLWNDAQQLAGIRDPSLGKNPPGVKTVGALMLLRESDLAGLTMFRAGFDHAYCRVGRQKLVLAKAHYRAPRLIRTVGQNQAVKVTAFLGAELRSTQDVRPRSLPVMTELEKRQTRQEAVAAGLFGPYAGPQDKHAKLTALLNTGIPGIEEEVERLSAPVGYEGLRQLCGELDARQAALAMLQTEAQAKGLQAALAQAAGAGQEGAAEQQEGAAGQAVPR